MDWDRAKAKSLGHVRRRFHFLEGKFRILVNMAPPRDHSRFDLVREEIDIGLRRDGQSTRNGQ